MRASTEFEMKYALSLVWLCLIWMWDGCTSFPPSSVSAGFFGANVTVATPGWSAPVAVVPYAVITKPTLLVPPTSPAANELTATVAPTANTPATAVAVVVAPVATETLAIPIKVQ